MSFKYGEELNKMIISEEEFIARNWEYEIKTKYGFYGSYE